MLLRLLFLLLISGSVYAQKPGTLKIYISPPPETIMIDGVELESGNIKVLNPGKYFLSAWSPGRELLDTIVEVKPGEVTSFFHKMPYSKEFIAYQAKDDAYNKEKGIHLAIPIVTTGLVAGSLLFTYLKGSQIYDDTQEAYDEYKYATINIEDHKIKHEELKNQYQGYVTAYYVEWAALAVSSYFLYKGIKWARNNKAPVYHQEKNPLKLENVGLGRDFRSGAYTVGLTFSLF